MTTPRKDPKHWTTEDGHRYTSVPINPPLLKPARYITCQDIKGRLCYSRGPYTIVRSPYGPLRSFGPVSVGTRFTYTVLRDREEIGFLYSRLKDAKEHVERNALGLDVVNVA